MASVTVFARRDAAVCVAHVPDAKDPVEQESTEEAEDHVGPGVPGVELHELRRVQVHVLGRSGRKKPSG